MDDIIFGVTNKDLCQEFAELMQNEFEISMMGELTFFLELQIKQIKKKIFVNQIKYIREILKKLGMKNAKENGTLTSPTCRLYKNENGKSVNEKLHRDTIGSLLYLTVSRPDILFSIYLCARF